ncbi:GNAT family N-acetyltransferase [Shewanella sp. AS1]|uniref:GNAT family N-acetyltransferase n=1 Tax=Shewanella sp. AS1 TaxID=2907626 RepID=UPI001F421D35|nr:GNAT family N-acetyltransferase [Shewanella sp. AS1]MCE9677742.1 GNAT family N-acetyltransferase [Shewanella sp. AS1]
MQIRLAQIHDASAIAALEQNQWQAELSQRERQQMQGQTFSLAEIKQLISEHWIMIAEMDGKIRGYVIAGHWTFFQGWPLYRHLLSRLNQHQIGHTRLSRDNCCQYGPIWIDGRYRGRGLFEALVTELSRHLAKEYEYMLTFIAEDNERSFAAHTRKGQMQVLDFFDFDGRGYYLLAAPTH